MNLEKLNNKIKELEKENKLFKKEIKNLENKINNLENENYINELKDLVEEYKYKYYEQSLYGYTKLNDLLYNSEVIDREKEFLNENFYKWKKYIIINNNDIYNKLNIIYNYDIKNDINNNENEHYYFDKNENKYYFDEYINEDDIIQNKFINIFLDEILKYNVLDILKTEENIEDFLSKFKIDLAEIHYHGVNEYYYIDNKLEIFDYLIEYIDLNDIFENINDKMLEFINNIINKNWFIYFLFINFLLFII